MKTPFLRPSRLVIPVLITVFVIGLISMTRTLYSRDTSIYQVLKTNIDVLQQIVRLVDDYYFEPVDWQKLMTGAFQGLMDKLDPHSVYIPAKDQAELSELFRGDFQGIGIEFDILHGYITVITPIPGSPAEHVGLQPGDQITAINGEDAYKITTEEVFTKLRGRKGTAVDLTVRRVGQEKPVQVTIIRDDIPIYSVRAALMLDDVTGYIWLARFSAKTSEEVRAALQNLEKQGMRRLVFDVRNNSGGYLDQAAEIANLFIPTRDTLVYTAGKRRDASQVFLSDPRLGRGDFPLIILINQGSASASEIVAGAVQDLDRGLIIGETSFGKGLVQRQWPLSDGSALRVTVARYFTPSGRLIQKPYEEGNLHQYYSDLYDPQRESKLDSLKQSRPRYTTRAGRTVYGGGGITPDIFTPWKLELQAATRQLVTSPQRPFFNWATLYSNRLHRSWPEFRTFRDSWSLSDADYAEFLRYLRTEDIPCDSAALEPDREYLKNLLKSEIASAVWTKDEGYGIRLQFDNQLQGAVQYFDSAAVFIAEKP